MSTCIKPLATYTCSNATGTTCAKVTATVYVISANTTCPAGELAVLTPAEKASFDSMPASITALNTSTTSLQTSGSTVTADVTTLKGQMNLIQAGTTLQASPTVRVDVMQAEGIVFGVTLAAAATIWGVKQIFRLFKGEPNGD